MDNVVYHPPLVVLPLPRTLLHSLFRQLELELERPPTTMQQIKADIYLWKIKIKFQVRSG